VKVETILSQIDLGTMALPEFQRGYVWNRDQVRGLMASMYRRHPVGSLLTWLTPKDPSIIRGGDLGPAGTIELLLDGQQRITSLYGIIRGRTPRFFDGNAQAFTNLYFDLENEVFEFYAPAKMAGKPMWLDVTRLMHPDGLGEVLAPLAGPGVTANLQTYISRLTRLTNIKDIELHIEQVVGEDKTVDVVVDIFNRVNSGGTKLSKGDLALARICARWPEARTVMKTTLQRWHAVGFSFDLDWLLRSVTTIHTGQARFSGLADIETVQFKEALGQAEKATNRVLNLVSARLGLDHDRVLGGRYAFPVMTRLLAEHGGFRDAAEQDRLLYWYVHSFLWGRYATSVESVMNQDLTEVVGQADAVDRLIERLRASRGDLTVRPADFGGWSLGARFYPLLYLVTRMAGARDLAALGLELRAAMLGKLTSLQVHHIFPKAVLYRDKGANYSRSEVNAVANYCFLTQEANLEISDRLPEDYLAEAERRFPGALASQWIPTDPALWKVDRYRDFLAARRELLATAANAHLDGLMHAPATEAPIELPTEVGAAENAGIIEAIEPAVAELSIWATDHGFGAPVFELEIVDPENNELIIVGDAVWPNGVQEGLTEPVCLELDASTEVITRLSEIGYRCFTEVEPLKTWAEAVSGASAPEASIDTLATVT
jgi:hypothetical protein